MTAYLNDDTFVPEDWSDAHKIQSFVLFCCQFEIGHVAVFEESLPYISMAKKNEKLSRDIRSKMQSLFIRPYVKANPCDSAMEGQRFKGHEYTISVDGGKSHLPGRKFAWSHLHGGILIGIAGSKYGDSFQYEVNERDRVCGKLSCQFVAYMASKVLHFGEPIFKRWIYACKSCGNIEYAKVQKYIHFPACHVKHFSPAGLSKKQWLLSTRASISRNKVASAAKFINGIKKDSLAYAYLVSSAIRVAFENLRYSDYEQNRFSIDVGCVIGAAQGKETTVLALYVTNGVDIHIRPYEGPACVCRPKIGEELKRYL